VTTRRIPILWLDVQSDSDGLDEFVKYLSISHYPVHPVNSRLWPSRDSVSHGKLSAVRACAPSAHVRQYQSIEPWYETSAAVWQSPMAA
jgi:hypothetical protein